MLSGKKQWLLILWVVLLLKVLSAQDTPYRENYMDTLWTQYGEMLAGDYTNYGQRMTAIDFNGDTIEDLIVGAGNSDYNKFYFYLGGNDFDNIADYYIYKVRDDTASFYQSGMFNIGDFNGDDNDDLMSFWVYYSPSEYRYAIKIYYCGNGFDLIPDWTHLILREGNEGALFNQVGDINGDNHSDIGYILKIPGEEIEDNCNKMYVIYGDESMPYANYFATVGTYYDSSGNHTQAIYDIDNVNGDEYDDFMVKYYDPAVGHHRNYIYYGGNPPDTLEDFSIEIYEASAGGFGCGDYNNDGFNDFIADTWEYNKFWYGCEQQFNENPDLLLEAEYADEGHSFGDLNNDGYSDIIMANSSYSLWDGKVYIFIGGDTNSTSYDYSLYTHNAELNWSWGEFGTSIASGDFNNDGYDDLAVGAPDPDGHLTYGNPNYIGYGRVFVFAGNADLTEIDSIGANGNEIPAVDGIEFNAYPNPFNPVVSFEIIAEDYANLQIEVFNVKGQRVKTIPVTLGGVEGSLSWNAEEQASGIYFSKLVNVATKTELADRKITLLK
jgi:hypothetical protein